MKLKLIALLTLAIGLGAAGAASAADMAVKAPPPPPPVPVFSWTGCYIGVNGGYGWGHSDTATIIDPLAAFGNAAPSAQFAYNTNMSPRVNTNGGLAGGQVGCNYQTGVFVIGIEGDIDWMGLRGSTTTTVIPVGHDQLFTGTSVSTDWLATIRGRAGFTWNRAFVYATGGAAFTEVKYAQFNTFVGCCTEAAAFSNSKVGWTVGGGVEYAFTDNWTAKAEYLYAQFDSSSTFGRETASNALFTHSADLRLNIVRVGLNYKFGGPVIARY